MARSRVNVKEGDEQKPKSRRKRFGGRQGTVSKKGRPDGSLGGFKERGAVSLGRRNKGVLRHGQKRVGYQNALGSATRRVKWRVTCVETEMDERADSGLSEEEARKNTRRSRQWELWGNGRKRTII